MAPVRRRAEALIVALAILAPACREPNAQTVLDAYFANLRHGRIREAYALTTPSYRAHHDLNTFALAAARQPIFDRGERQGVPDRQVVVELTADGAAPLRLVADSANAPYRLVEDPRDYYPQSTPERTLASFARAIALGRGAYAWALIAGSLYGASGARAPITPAMMDLGKRIERGLSATSPAPIVIEGNGATFLMSDGYTVTLIRGARGWEISSFE
jgi:hypothetical protein